MISRMLLGTSDVFSGLFALRAALSGIRASKHGPADGSSLVLDSLLRRQARCIDVPVAVDDRFRSRRLRFRGPAPSSTCSTAGSATTRGSCSSASSGRRAWSSTCRSTRCCNGCCRSPGWPTGKSALFGATWHLAIAAGLSIAIALVWNFTLNRRLTFNDAHKGALSASSSPTCLSNALAIVLSFSVRLYLPAHVGFFARHRLAAAVVGIVAATGISFSMARWLVFARRPS